MATKKKTKPVKKSAKTKIAPAKKMAALAVPAIPNQQLELSGTGAHLAALGYITDQNGGVISGCTRVGVSKSGPYSLKHLPPAGYVYVFNLDGAGAASIRKAPDGATKAMIAPAANRSYPFQVS